MVGYCFIAFCSESARAECINAGISMPCKKAKILMIEASTIYRTTGESNTCIFADRINDLFAVTVNALCAIPNEKTNKLRGFICPLTFNFANSTGIGTSGKTVIRLTNSAARIFSFGPPTVAQISS